MSPRIPRQFVATALSLAVCSLLALMVQPDWSAGSPSAQTNPPGTQEAAREIDRLVQVGLKRNGLNANGLADDGMFMRRIYLDVIGRIPSAAESREFLDSKNPNKRDKLIETLLDSPGRVSRDFNFWGDILRVKTRVGNQVSGEPYMDWLRKSLIANKHYDDMVRELIVAEGPANARDNGATGYLLRDFNMPHDNVANTMRVFLGTRIECAQCHNHPFEDWTQRQFYELAAFQGGIRYRAGDRDPREIREFQQAARKIREEQGEQAYQYLRRQYLLVLGPGISGTGSGLERLPKDYQYDDAKAEDFVTARAIMGPDVHLDVAPPTERNLGRRRQQPNNAQRNRMPQMPENASRRVYGDWLTSADNSRFVTVIVNRIWEKLMGRGLIDPVDDIKDSSVCENPELLTYLEDLMVALDFDLIAFQKAILSSSSYQRISVARDLLAGEPYHFEGPLMRRLTAEQLWDSMLTLVSKDIDATITTGTSTRAEAVYRNYEQAAGKNIQEVIAEASAIGSDEQAARRAIRNRNNSGQAEARQLLRALQAARRQNDKAKEAEIEAQLEAMGVDLERFQIQRRFGNDMLRASELPQPAPAGHFLRDFGQSDREQIDAGVPDANVPQVLNLLNGFLEENLFKKQQGDLLQSIRNVKDPAQKIRNAFITILSRRPDQSEVALWRDEARSGGDEVWRDLIWTLVNSHEFRFQR